MVLANAVNSFAQAFPYVLADFQANVASLATSASITALNDFDPSADTVATVGTVSNPVSANVSTVGTDAIDAASLKSDAVAEIQTGLATATELGTVPKIGTQYTHTAQSGDTIQVTIS